MARGQPSSALWQAVAARMREDILAGRMSAGSKLTEADLAEAFGTSRGPVREAIRELAREGLVVELPRRGAIVSSLTARDLSEVYGVREALECGVAKVVIARADDEDLRALGGHLDALEAPEGGYLDRSPHDVAFHRDYVALAGNHRMNAIGDQMLTQTMLLLRTAATDNPALRSDMRPAAHRAILAALLDRDEAAARAAIEAHYRYAEERLFPGVAAS